MKVEQGQHITVLCFWEKTGTWAIAGESGRRLFSTLPSIPCLERLPPGQGWILAYQVVKNGSAYSGGEGALLRLACHLGPGVRILFSLAVYFFRFYRETPVVRTPSF